MHPVFSMYFSTIKRDSALLEGHTRERDAIAAVESSLDEMKLDGVLSSFTKNPILGLR